MVINTVDYDTPYNTNTTSFVLHSKFRGTGKSSTLIHLLLRTAFIRRGKQLSGFLSAAFFSAQYFLSAAPLFNLPVH